MNSVIGFGITKSLELALNSGISLTSAQLGRTYESEDDMVASTLLD